MNFGATIATRSEESIDKVCLQEFYFLFKLFYSRKELFRRYKYKFCKEVQDFFEGFFVIISSAQSRKIIFV